MSYLIHKHNSLSTSVSVHENNIINTVQPEFCNQIYQNSLLYILECNGLQTHEIPGKRQCTQSVIPF